MPLASLLRLNELGKAPITEDTSPGETVAPILGSSARPPHGKWRLPFKPFIMDTMSDVKMSGISLAAFADELEKIAYVPNTPGDQAGVLRALLTAMLGRGQFVPSDEPSTDQIAEHQLLYGGDEGRASYMEYAQSRMAQQLMNRTRLQAALESQQGPAHRVIG